MNDEILKEKIRRARLSGPPMVTAEATVAEMDAQGNLSVLHQRTNQWICFPGHENVIGDVPMSLDPMGMQWYRDLRARRGHTFTSVVRRGMKRMPLGRSRRLDDVLCPLLRPRDENMMPIHDKLMVSIDISNVRFR